MFVPFAYPIKRLSFAKACAYMRAAPAMQISLIEPIIALKSPLMAVGIWTKNTNKSKQTANKTAANLSYFFRKALSTKSKKHTPTKYTQKAGKGNHTGTYGRENAKGPKCKSPNRVKGMTKSHRPKERKEFITIIYFDYEH
jgi:hypothetical protein